MRRTLVLAVLASFTLSGCIIHSHGRGRNRGGGTPSCHPSQYWDGHQCRHKGKGHGARKHDGRKK